MKKAMNIFMVLIVLSFLFIAGCKKDNVDEPQTNDLQGTQITQTGNSVASSSDIAAIDTLDQELGIDELDDLALDIDESLFE